MVKLVWQPHQQVTNCLVEALSDNGGSVADKGREVVEPRGWLIKVFDWHHVGISKANHMRENLMGMFPLPSDSHIEDALKPGNPHLCMLVHESREQCTAHILAEMEQLVTATGCKLFHTLASLNND
jgi:hypothetical protein